MSPGATEKLDWYQRHRDRPLTLDDCPDCERPMTLVLAVGGGPEVAGGGSFLYCERCRDLYVRAEGNRVPVPGRHALMLAREVLRLRAPLDPPAAAGPPDR
jgi:hypothetical protein